MFCYTSLDPQWYKICVFHCILSRTITDTKVINCIKWIQRFYELHIYLTTMYYSNNLCSGIFHVMPLRKSLALIIIMFFYIYFVSKLNIRVPRVFFLAILLIALRRQQKVRLMVITFRAELPRAKNALARMTLTLQRSQAVKFKIAKRIVSCHSEQSWSRIPAQKNEIFLPS